MKMQPFSLLAALALGACATEQEDPIHSDLWSTELVSGVDGVYVRLPHAGKLIRLSDTGAVEQVDLNGAEPQQLVSVPDGSKTLAFAQWTECEDDDESIVYLSDCDSDEIKTHTELHIVSDGQTTGQLDIPGFRMPGEDRGWLPYTSLRPDSIQSSAALPAFQSFEFFHFE